MAAVEQLNVHEKEILKERAKRLAQPLVETIGEQLHVFQFISKNQNYALESAFISEVAPLVQMRPLPGVPPFVLGVINLHGRIIAVLDLQSIMRITPTQPTIAANVIILQGVSSEFGLLAEEIIGFVSIPIAKLQLPLPSTSSSGVTYVEGVTTDGIVFLSAEKLLLDISLVVKHHVGSV
jgi:purine-binding chemotaxis protein CheW